MLQTVMQQNLLFYGIGILCFFGVISQIWLWAVSYTHLICGKPVCMMSKKRKEDKTMEFLPNPKQMEYHTGHFLPGSQTKIVLCGTEPGAFLYAQMLQKELKEEAGLSLDILRALRPTESGDIVLCLDQRLEKDHYQLAIEEDKISLAAGSDEAFGRSSAMDAPISEGPFWAVRVTPNVHTTAGGIRINEAAQVLDKSEQPIPGLYAAGEVTGGVHDGVSAVCGAIVYGRIAGTSAGTYAES